MTTTPWHLDGELAGRYATGVLGPVLAASVEQHLVACAHCRSLLADHVDTPRLDRVWNDVLERVEAPRRTLLERLLGVPAGTVKTRMMRARRALRKELA